MKLCYYLCDQAKTRKSKGIWVYTNNLITSLAKMKRFEIVALTSADGPQLPGVENVILPFRTGNIPSRLIIDHIHPLALPKADIYHYPKGFLPFFCQKGAPLIASILDTIGVHYYDNYRGNASIFRPFELEYWLAVLSRTLKQADAVITISQKSAEAIHDYCERKRIIAPPVFVTHLASKFTELPIDSSSVVKLNYVVHFASPLPHKRTSWLLEAWRIMESRRNDIPDLCLIGTLSKEQSIAADALQKIKVVANVNDEDLKSMIMSARALIYPSEIEGFGLPALEAYQLGTPALYVADTSVDEIMKIDGKNVPGRFHLDLDDFSRAFDQVLNVPASEIALIQKEMFAMYTWEKTANDTFAVYEKVL